MKSAKSPTPVAALPSSSEGPVFFHPGTGPMLPRRAVGRKGHTMLALASMGAPVPPGFIVTSDRCRAYLTDHGRMGAITEEIGAALARLGSSTGTAFGDARKPLLVSLRASAPEAMPGTPGGVVHLGLTEAAIPALAQQWGDPRMAWDAYRRLVLSYALNVERLPAEEFDALLAHALESAKVESDAELDTPAMQALAKEYGAAFARLAGTALPANPAAMMERAAAAVFSAWSSTAAQAHRREHGLEHLPGTALIVQAMAIGTRQNRSGAGHCYTRLPSTGEKKLHGKFIAAAQGGDLTAGTRMTDGLDVLNKRLPDIHQELAGWAERLERQFHDALEIEFTVDDSALYILNCRPASRTPRASLRIATDLVDERVCTQQQGLLLVTPQVADEYLHPVLDKSSAKSLLTQGLGASPGSAVGQVVFFAEHAVELAAQGTKVILVRHETSPEDIDGLKVSQGIVTAHGGLTSHAAVVGRGMGKCCVVGAGEIHINYLLNEMTVGDATVKRLDWISLDGTTGEIFLGQLPQVQPTIEGRMARVLEWADAARTIGVHANADTPDDARRAVELGAGGIGLCRTEHMFFDIDRIPVFRKMILAVDENGRHAALSELLPLQRKDFLEIFRVMNGRPVTVRLLDPPLNEFLPKGIRSQTRMAKAMRISVEAIQQRTEALAENNPMMGHRGCRLAVTYPEIYNMQVRAIVEAACIVRKEGTPVNPEIMVPLISTARELEYLQRSIRDLVERVMAELGERIEIKIGTMIETPRAAVCSASIAPFADFYSFGTNDLTQMGYGFSRDDAGMFLPMYLEQGILKEDPFMTLDQEGIGAMVRLAVEAGRKINPSLKFGICGEHGGEPRSVKFFHRAGLDYVSCSPFRIPVARLAAGQAALEQDEANA